MPTTIVLIWTIVVYSAMNNKFAFILILTWQSCHSYGNIVWRSDAQKHDGILMTLHENMRRLLLLLVIVDITAAELLCSLWLFIWSSWNDVRCGKIVNSLYIFSVEVFPRPRGVVFTATRQPRPDGDISTASRSLHKSHTGHTRYTQSTFPLHFVLLTITLSHRTFKLSTLYTWVTTDIINQNADVLLIEKIVILTIDNHSKY